MLNRRSLMLCAAAGLLMPAAASADTIKVGIILSYSGPSASLGQQIDRGMAIYQKLHPDVPGGHKIELVKSEDAGIHALA